MDAQALMEWRGRDVIDRDGDKLGTFEDLYVDDQTGRPEFGLIKTGLFGRRATLVPIGDATAEGEALRVPFEKARVKDAPSVDPDAHLSVSEEAELYRYYGMTHSENVTAAAESTRAGEGEGDEGGERGTGGDAERLREGGAESQAGTRTGYESAQGGATGESAQGTATGERAQDAAAGDTTQGTATGERAQDAAAGGTTQGGATTGDTSEGGDAETSAHMGGHTRLRKFVVTEETRVDRELVTDEVREDR